MTYTQECSIIRLIWIIISFISIRVIGGSSKFDTLTRTTHVISCITKGAFIRIYRVTDKAAIDITNGASDTYSILKVLPNATY